MAFVSVNRIAVRPGSSTALDALAEQFMRARQELQQRGELLASQMARAEDGSEYLLISVWASREAHDRNEDSPVEQATLRQLAQYVAAAPSEFTGEVVAELR